MKAVALYNPKFENNVATVLRSCACWGVDMMLWSGDRVRHPYEYEGDRIPREFRMKQYKDVKLIKTEKFKSHIDGFTPVAVEFIDEAENLFDFIHPENPFYIFGSEDGTLDSRILRLCHRFVRIPTRYCLNVSNAVNVVLAHEASAKFNQGTTFERSVATKSN